MDQNQSDVGHDSQTGQSERKLVDNILNTNEQKYLKESKKSCNQSCTDHVSSIFKIAQGPGRFLSLRSFDDKERKSDDQPLSLQEELQLSIENIVADESNEITQHYNGQYNLNCSQNYKTQ